MRIEVLGTGCPKCQATLRNVEQAVRELSIQAEIAKVDDLVEITARGVMVTPALAIDGEIVCSGRIPSVEEIKAWLQGK